jgi:hypothetical protein
MSELGRMFRELLEERRAMMKRPPSWWNLFALAPILFFLIICVRSWKNDAQIAKRQQTTIGQIDRHDPPNHDRYGYTFSVNGKKFTGWANPTDRRSFSVGERIVIYYDPMHPTENSAYDYNEVNPGGVVFIGWLVMGCAFIPLVIFLQRRASKNADLQPKDP